MKQIKTYQNMKVLVLGLAKSGMSAAKLLHELGAFVTINDGKPLEENSDAQELLDLGITVITGEHPIELLDEGFQLVVKNPGIPYNNAMIVRAQELDIPIITEVQLAYEVSEAPIVGITGTNGKTTTTTMIGEILNHFQNNLGVLSGNIGYPASTKAQEVSKNQVLVMELSSFQLLGITTFKPHIAVITNLFEAHIDYHGTREEYVAAKWNLQQNMSAADYLVLNFNQPELREFAQKTKATVIPFASEFNCEIGAHLKADKLYYDEDLIMSVDEIGVPGDHNIENTLAAIAVAKLLHIPNEDIRIALSTFSGVAHRLEFVRTVAGVKYYNDSKATNILATSKALSGFNNNSLILIAGGLDRGNEFDELIPHLKGLKGIVVYGETRDKLQKAAKTAGVEKIVVQDNLNDAVKAANKIAIPGDCVLLSPACASWDQYPNFEIRGNVFVNAVKEI